MKTMYVIDGWHGNIRRDTWLDAITAIGKRRNWEVVPVSKIEDVKTHGYVFVRPFQYPPGIAADKVLSTLITELSGMIFIQDPWSIVTYDNKVMQMPKLQKWLPATQLIINRGMAKQYLETVTYPFISKAAVGSSSYNVRLIKNRKQAFVEIETVFRGSGLRLEPRGRFPRQLGYLYWQEFIKHDVTYRVNIIGREVAIFKRFNFAARPMAQTGNVVPVKDLDDTMYDLLDYAAVIFDALDTKWNALDILETPDGWRLLEASLAWPWPSPGDCDNCLFWPSERKWTEMFEIMFDEIEAGVWLS